MGFSLSFPPLAGSGLLLYLCAKIVECYGIEHFKLQSPDAVGEDQTQRQTTRSRYHQDGAADVLRAQEQ